MVYNSELQGILFIGFKLFYSKKYKKFAMDWLNTNSRHILCLLDEM